MIFFQADKYSVRSVFADGREVCFRAFENNVYVENPTDAEYQSLNIYAPEVFFSGGAVGGYTINTAPIFFENGIGGYMPCKPAPPEREAFGRVSASFYALEHGYVVVSPGARGRTNQNSAGKYYGKAPAALSDLRAALRFLRDNAGKIPGDVNRIISIGTSAGGSLAALTGVCGEVFAVCAYCPVTDLEHADMAYEWQFDGIYDYAHRRMVQKENDIPIFAVEEGTMTKEQISLSMELAGAFPAHLNSLGLLDATGKPLKLNPDGTGTFRDHICGLIKSAAEKSTGASVPDIDFAKFMRDITRMKLTPAFDDIAMCSFENNLFGDINSDCAHFTRFSYNRSVSVLPKMADAQIIAEMNPLNYIGKCAKPAKYWRIRQGTKDRDVGFATPTILAIKLQNSGADVDFSLVWDEPHGGNYDLPELFAWIDGIVS